MYFDPVDPKAVEHWLSGLRVGCSLAGLGPEAIVDELLAIEAEMWGYAGRLGIDT